MPDSVSAKQVVDNDAVVVETLETLAASIHVEESLLEGFTVCDLGSHFEGLFNVSRCGTEQVVIDAYRVQLPTLRIFIPFSDSLKDLLVASCPEKLVSIIFVFFSIVTVIEGEIVVIKVPEHVPCVVINSAQVRVLLVSHRSGNGSRSNRHIVTCLLLLEEVC